LEIGKRNYKQASVNIILLPMKKRIGQCLVWIASELQRLINIKQSNKKNFLVQRQIS
jgi:hypothetical protein